MSYAGYQRTIDLSAGIETAQPNQSGWEVASEKPAPDTLPADYFSKAQPHTETGTASIADIQSVADPQPSSIAVGAPIPPCGR
jgi:hypothetical protein